MLIVLDARFMTHPQVGGFKTYTTNLVEALAAARVKHEFRVYVDRPPSADVQRLAHGIPLVVVPPGPGALGMPWREQVTLRSQIRRDKPDLVHFLCNTATIGLQTPNVVTLHDVLTLTGPAASSNGRSGRLRQWSATAYSRIAIRAAMRQATLVIAPSDHARQEIAQRFSERADRIRVVHEAPAPVFRPLPAPEREARSAEVRRRLALPPRFVFAVGYEPRKNIELAIDTVARLGAHHRDVGLVILASDRTGERRTAFAERARRQGLAGRVTVLDRLGDEDLLALYATCQAFLFPSADEGFGLPPLEAMASGAPTLAMRAACLPEVLGDGALLVMGTDPGAWAAALSSVLEDASLRCELSNRGVRRAATFTWRRCALETIAVYEQAIACAADRHTRN